jgi:hypothetical protein
VRTKVYGACNKLCMLALHLLFVLLQLVQRLLFLTLCLHKGRLQ